MRNIRKQKKLQFSVLFILAIFVVVTVLYAVTANIRLVPDRTTAETVDVTDIDDSAYAKLGLGSAIKDGTTPMPMGTSNTLGENREIYVHANANRGSRVSLRNGVPFDASKKNGLNFYDLRPEDLDDKSGASILGRNPSSTGVVAESRDKNVYWAGSYNKTNYIYVSAIELNLNDINSTTPGKKNFVAEVQVLRDGIKYVAYLRIYEMTTSGRRLNAYYRLGDVFENNWADKKFGLSYRMQELDSIIDIAAGDINGDGIDDIAVTWGGKPVTANKGGLVKVFLGKSKGVGMVATDIETQGTRSAVSLNEKWMSTPTISLDISNLRGDGLGDILTISQSTTPYLESKAGALIKAGQLPTAVYMYSWDTNTSKISTTPMFSHTISSDGKHAPTGLSASSVRAFGEVYLIAAGYGNVKVGVDKTIENSISYFVYKFDHDNKGVKIVHNSIEQDTSIANGIPSGKGNIYDTLHYDVLAQAQHRAPCAVAAAALDGKNNDDTILIAGKLYTLQSTGTLFDPNQSIALSTKVTEAIYLIKDNTYNSSQTWIGDVRVGVVAGKNENTLRGQEQFLAVTGRNRGNSYWMNISAVQKKDGTTYVMGEELVMSQLSGNEMTGAYVALALPDVDDESISARFVDQYNIVTNPTIHTILHSAPFYEDIKELDDNYGGGSTSYSNGNSVSEGHSVSVSSYAGVYVEVDAGIGVGVNAEFEASLGLGYSHSWETEVTVEIEYSVDAGVDAVVVYCIPYTIYQYEYYYEKDQTWRPLVLRVPQPASISMISVDTYDEVANASKGALIPIRTNTNGGAVLGHTNHTIGDPSSYNNTFSNKPNGGSWDIFPDKNTWHPVNTIKDAAGTTTITKSTSTSQTNDVDAYISVNTKLAGGAKFMGQEFMVGVVGGIEVGYGYSKTNTNSFSYSGAVQSLPLGYESYAFSWQVALGTFKMPATEGKKTYSYNVVGYQTKGVGGVASLRTPQNLSADPEAKSIMLNWEKTTGISGYRIEMFAELGGNPITYNVSGQSTTSYKVTGLSEYTTYWFRIRGEGSGGNTLYSPMLETKTTVGNFYKGTNPSDKIVTVGDTVKFTTDASFSKGISYQWKRQLLDGTIQDVTTANTQNATGINTKELSFTATYMDSGIKYICAMTYDTTKTFDTNAATLTVNKKASELAATINENTSLDDFTGVSVILETTLNGGAPVLSPTNIVKFVILKDGKSYANLDAHRSTSKGNYFAMWVPTVAGVYTITAQLGDNNVYASALSNTITCTIEALQLEEISLAEVGFMVYGDSHNLAPINTSTKGVEMQLPNFDGYTVTVLRHGYSVSDQIDGLIFKPEFAGEYEISVTKDIDENVTTTITVLVLKKDASITAEDVTVLLGGGTELIWKYEGVFTADDALLSNAVDISSVGNIAGADKDIYQIGVSLNSSDAADEIKNKYNITFFNGQYTVLQPVTNISGVPATVFAGTRTVLSAVITPDDAVRKEVMWRVLIDDDTVPEEDRLAYIDNDNVLVAIKDGTITLVASIAGGAWADGAVKNYEKEFTVTINKAISKIVILGGDMTMKRGTDHDFVAVVDPEELMQNVNWSIEGSNHNNTQINALGKLVVDAAESALKITVRATSVYDSTKSATVTVYLTGNTVPDIGEIIIESNVTGVITRGDGGEFYSTVNNSLDEIANGFQEVIWSIEGNNHKDTTIKEIGSYANERNQIYLNISSAETAKYIIVRATSIHDPSKSGKMTIELSGDIYYDIQYIMVTPSVSTLKRGNTLQFTHFVVASGPVPQDVIWTVMGANHAGTTINANGLLTVSAAETADSITVNATSYYDPYLASINTVSVSVNLTGDITHDVLSVLVYSEENWAYYGESIQIYAKVNAAWWWEDEVISQEVIWSIEGVNNKKTTIDSDGLLYVAAGETAESVTIRATSAVDLSKSGILTISVWGEIIPDVDYVVVTPGTSTAERGVSIQFSAIVLASHSVSQDVVWEISNALSPKTNINEFGLLTIAKEESSEYINIYAVYKYDESKVGQAIVTLTGEFIETFFYITPETPEVERGKTLDFGYMDEDYWEEYFQWMMADQDDDGLALIIETLELDMTVAELKEMIPDLKLIVWNISGANHKDTKIDKDGLLTVSKDETAQSILVIATSWLYRDSHRSQVTVKITGEEPPIIDYVLVSPFSAEVQQGGELQISHLIVASKTVSQAVTWTIEGAVDIGTKIDKNGLLTIAIGETAKQLTVRATSVYDNSKYGTMSISVIPSWQGTGNTTININIDGTVVNTVKLWLNNEEVNVSYYTVTNNGDIEIYETYLKTLRTGTYRFVAEYNNEITETFALTVNNVQNDTSKPNNGIPAWAIVLIVLGGVIILGIAGFSVYYILSNKKPETAKNEDAESKEDENK